MLVPRMRQGFFALEIAAACALMAACGGGGGGGAAQEAGAPVASASATSDTASAPATSDTASAPSGEIAAAPADPAAPADGSAQTAEAGPPEFEGGSMEARSLAEEQESPAVEDPQATADASADMAGERETAQTLTIDSNDASYSRPKVAAVDYSSDSTSTRQALLAKFRFAIIGSRVGTTLTSFSAGLHARNPNIKQAYYTAFNEIPCSTTSGSYYYPMVQLANKANYWLRTASGSLSQWTSYYNTCNLNITYWGRKDSSGWTWMQRKAQFDWNTAFSKLPYVSYVMADNVFWRPRNTADWKRIGTNQLYTDPTLASPVRSGAMAYANALRGYNYKLQVLGNADGDLSQSEFKQKLSGAFYEGAIGKSWSIETWSTWAATMARYRALRANTTGGREVFFSVYGSATDYRTMRYGLASSLLDDGWYVYLPTSGGLRPIWFDEYDARIGTAIDPPPTSPKQNGVYMRRYSNGVVLVNPSKTSSASIYVGTGYKRLKGSQDPAVNNGQVQSTVTLGPRQGLLMVRN